MSKKIINQHHKEISLRIHFSDLYFEKKNFDENSVKSTSDNKIDKNILFHIIIQGKKEKIINQRHKEISLRFSMEIR